MIFNSLDCGQIAKKKKNLYILTLCKVGTLELQNIHRILFLNILRNLLFLTGFTFYVGYCRCI